VCPVAAALAFGFVLFVFCFGLFETASKPKVVVNVTFDIKIRLFVHLSVQRRLNNKQNSLTKHAKKTTVITLLLLLRDGHAFFFFLFL